MPNGHIKHMGGRITYMSRSYAVDSDGRIHDPHFTGLKKRQYKALAMRLEALWAGSGHLPRELSEAISRMHGAVAQCRAEVGSTLGIKTADHKFSDGRHNLTEARGS